MVVMIFSMELAVSQMEPTVKVIVGNVATEPSITGGPLVVANVSQVVRIVILPTPVTHVTYVATTHTGRTKIRTNADASKTDQVASPEIHVTNAVTGHMITMGTRVEELAFQMGRNVNLAKIVICVVRGPTIGIRRESILVVPKTALTMENLVFQTILVASVAVVLHMTVTGLYAVVNVWHPVRNVASCQRAASAAMQRPTGIQQRHL